MRKAVSASRYARAFVKAFGRSEKKLEQLLAESKKFRSWLSENFEAFMLLESPVLQNSERSRLLDSLATKIGVGEELKKLFAVMAAESALVEAKSVLLRIEDLIRRKLCRPKVKVSVARQISEKEKERLRAIVAELFPERAMPEIVFEEDSSLLCGFRIIGGGLLLDMSALRLLKKIELAARKGVLG